jgi:hypothetical protein
MLKLPSGPGPFQSRVPQVPQKTQILGFPLSERVVHCFGAPCNSSTSAFRIVRLIPNADPDWCLQSVQ